jgi:hypothetical protein
MDSSPLKILGFSGETPDIRAIRKAYLRESLKHHPDKPGGDAAAFEAVHTAFNILKQKHDRGEPLDGFACTGPAFSSNPAAAFHHDWYAAAEGEAIPGYKVERAPTNRSTCQKTKCLIAKGEIRIGSFDALAGNYGRWRRLSALRVPATIWLGLGVDANASLNAMEGVTLVGYARLDDEAKSAFIAHVTDANNHAKLNKLTRPAEPTEPTEPAEPTESSKMVESSKTDNALTTVAKLALPRPGVDGVAAGQLQAATCVLTGVFDVEGGGGFMRGKEGVKTFLQGHGAKVVGSVSKKTTHVVAGRLPGYDKLSKGRDVGATIVTLETLTTGLRANDVASAVEKETFKFETVELSKGYGGNGKGKRLTAEADDHEPKKLKN